MPHLRAFARVALEYGRLLVTGREQGEERTVRAAYRALLGREPRADELAGSSAELRAGSLRIGGLVHQLAVGAAQPPQPPAVDPAVAAALARVLDAAPPEPSAEQFVHATYQTLLGRLPDDSGRDAAVGGLRDGSLSQQAIVAAIIASDEYAQEGLADSGPSARQLYGQAQAAAGPAASDEAFLQAAYPLVLGRPADPGGVGHFTRLLARGVTSRPEVIASMMASAEYQLARGRQIKPMHALHQMRMQLFQEHLPPARRVLDLGGAAHNHDEGALLLMGYPHHPDEITIVDLPPEHRIGGAVAAESQREVVTGDGIRVRYLYRSMADLADLPAASFDLIVSGESIEHISEADGEIVCREAFRLLAPGGSFCLDTPNAAVTRLQSPDQFIHPEHQKEYLVHELHDMLTRNGFTIVAAKALCPMPASLRAGRFDASELGRSMGISDQPEQGYAFFLHALKPA